jgi:hypothetical protein
MPRQTKTHTIIYRVTDDEWQRIGAAAAAADGQEINDWSRQVTITRASQPGGMTGVERLVYEELACVRYLLSHGFGLLAGEQLSAAAWEKVKAAANHKPGEIADALLARRRQGRKTS